MPKQQVSISLTNIRETLPEVDESAACARKLKAALFEGISTSDMTEIMQGMVQKAKAGDPRAAKVVMDFVASQSVEPKNRTISKTSVSSTMSDERIRKRAAQVLGKIGPLAPTDLADELELPEADVSRALEHPWFERTSLGGVKITTVGRQEAIEGKVSE